MTTYNIETVSFCNLRCPSCPNGNTIDTGRSDGMMSFDLFEKILDKILLESKKESLCIALYNWGEPLLNPDLPRFVGLLNSAGLSYHISTNLNDIRHLERLIDANPRNIRVSISGNSDLTYGLTHAPGDIYKVIANAEFLSSIIAQRSSKTAVTFCYHKYLNNTGAEYESIKRLAEKLDFGWEELWAHITPVEKLLDYYNGKIALHQLPLSEKLAISPDEARDAVLSVRARVPDCLIRANQVTIDFDGSMPLCCAVYMRENYLIGNFLDVPHQDIQRQKYTKPICSDCMSNGIDLWYTFQAPSEFNQVVRRKTKEI